VNLDELFSSTKNTYNVGIPIIFGDFKKLFQERKFVIENPCVPGSIPGRATTNITRYQ